MRALSVAAAFTLLTAGPLFAQSERGYISGLGGFAVSPEKTSGDVLGEAGVRIARHIFVFGDLGQFHNLQPSEAQAAVDSTTALVSASEGLIVVGTPRVPAWYSIGGLRVEVPTSRRIAPYVIGGIGFARLKPNALFTYTSGPLPDGSTLAQGSDITSQLVAAGDFTAPPATNAFIFTLGGGLEIPLARHWAVDGGYRFSRVSLDNPSHAQGATFGLGYRF